MVRINLLPKEIKKKVEKREVGTLIFLGIGLVAAILIFSYLLQYTKYASLNKKLSLINKELAELKKITDQVERLEAAKNKLNQKLKVIKDLVKGRLIYPSFMEDLLELKSPSMWLTSLDVKDGNNILTLNINAIAFDNYTIADFMRALENSAQFSEVELGSISMASFGEKAYRQFRISCKYLLKE